MDSSFRAAERSYHQWHPQRITAGDLAPRDKQGLTGGNECAIGRVSAGGDR